MDPLTHGLVGGLAAKTVGTTRRRFWIMMLLGCAPDIDVLFNFLPGWAFWIQHRGITHSLAGLVLQVLFYSWIFQVWDPGPFRIRVWHYSLPLFLHTVCDGLTSFGVPLFSPFSFQEYSADLMGGLALIPILFMSVGLLQLHQKGSFGWRAARPLWVGWLLYLMMAISGKAYAGKLLENQKSLSTLPSVSNPFSWTAVVPDEKSWTYHQYSIDLMAGGVRSVRTVGQPIESEAVNDSIASPLVKKFLATSRWPVARVRKDESGTVVEWGALLFSTRGLVRGKIRIDLDSKGHILHEDKIFNFWDPPSA